MWNVLNKQNLKHIIYMCHIKFKVLYPLADDKILDLSIWKVYAGYKVDMA